MTSSSCLPRGCRHAEQTSEASGAAASQIGPYATALAADLKKEMGLSERKICRLFSHFGLAITPGGVAQAVARAGRRATPTYQCLVLAVRRAEVVTADETGWRVHGDSAWLRVFVGQRIAPDGAVVRFVVYLIAKRRGFPEASAVLRAGFTGVIERDGWAPYRKFVLATHQTCAAHLLRRVVGMIEDATGDEGQVPQALKEILKDALALRAARDTGEVGAEAVAEGVTALRRRVDALLAAKVTHPPNVRLLKHLANESKHLFTFLEREGVEACNWKGEQAIRPAVVNRKSWGGNFTWGGADTQRCSPRCSPPLGCRAGTPSRSSFPCSPAPPRGWPIWTCPVWETESGTRSPSPLPRPPCTWPVASTGRGPPESQLAGQPIRSGWWSTSALPPSQRL